MEYREINNCKISLLGFGCMRFPTLEDGVSIDEKKTEEMLDYAIEHGVNYLDTAFPYMSGKSEEFVGRYIKKYDRSKLYIATKLPIWDVKTLDDVKRIIDEQFKRLQVDYIDFYLISLCKYQIASVGNFCKCAYIFNKFSDKIIITPDDI